MILCIHDKTFYSFNILFHVGGMVDAYGPDAHTDTLGMLSLLTESPSDTIPKCLITDAVSADHMGLTFSLDPTGW